MGEAYASSAALPVGGSQAASRVSAILAVFLLALLAGGCASLPRDIDYGEPSVALGAAMQGPLRELRDAALVDAAPSTSAFALLDSGTDALLSRLALIDGATVSLDLQYYIWDADIAGRLMIRHLLAAADRGVRVRILVDDLVVAGGEHGVAALDHHPNISIRVFNPWRQRGLGRMLEFVLQIGRLNHRMHNKVLVADGVAGITGGRNIGDNYFGLSEQSNFHDLDVLALGPVVSDLNEVFDYYWNGRWAIPAGNFDRQAKAADLDRLRKRLGDRAGEDADASRAVFEYVLERRLVWIAEELMPGVGTVFSDRIEAQGVGTESWEAIQELFSRAQHELLVTNAYFIPGQRSIDGVARFVDNGGEVRVLTNSLASHDVPAVNSEWKKWRRPMLEAGARLYEVRADAAIKNSVVDMPPVESGFMGLHTKAAVVDRRYALIGTFNLDPRSAFLNTEMGLIVDSPELAQRLAMLMQRDMQRENAWRVSLDEDDRLLWTASSGSQHKQPARSTWSRVEDWFLGLLPIRSQL